MQVLVPVPPAAAGGSLRKRLDTLSGKVIGIIDNTKPNFNHLADDMTELLVNQYGVSKVLRRRKKMTGSPAEEMVQDLVAETDAVIVGLGD